MIAELVAAEISSTLPPRLVHLHVYCITRVSPGKSVAFSVVFVTFVPEALEVGMPLRLYFVCLSFPLPIKYSPLTGTVYIYAVYIGDRHDFVGFKCDRLCRLTKVKLVVLPEIDLKAIDEGSAL